MSDPEEEEAGDFLLNVPPETPLSPEEAVLRRHRKEKRELQGKILAMKKACGGGKLDKKKKKELGDEILALERDLEARQQAELTILPPKTKKIPPTAIPATVLEEEDPEKTTPPGSPKLSKARRRREKKEEEAKEKARRVAEETSHLFNSSLLKAEDEAFAALLKDLSLTLVDIPSDGNCLYAAISHQLSLTREGVEASELRGRTAAYLRGHKEEFLPFMEEEASASEEGFEAYVRGILDPSVWGGHLELRILSQVLARPITILQAQGVPVVVGEESKKKGLTLTYHRHRYRLGEHYNSTTTTTTKAS